LTRYTLLKCDWCEAELRVAEEEEEQEEESEMKNWLSVTKGNEENIWDFCSEDCLVRKFS
jgi:Fe-S-cluster-containing hydrogenase component 2